MKQCTISPFFDKRHVKDGKSPICISVSMPNKTQFLIRLPLYCTKATFDKAISGRGGIDEIKELRKKVSDYVTKGEAIVEKLPNPSKESFTRLFKSETDLFVSNKTEITYFFKQKIAELEQEERLGTRDTYLTSMRSLIKYKSPLYFEDIDEKFLKGYKTWMMNKGNSMTTAQIYTRNLRSIFNVAIKEGFISEKHYPFKNYSIGTSSKSKSVLYPEQIKALWNYETVGIREGRAKAFFFFCYLCNGMNFKDAMYLKFKNLKGDTFEFIREKTKRTAKSEKVIKGYLHPEAKQIIELWGNKPGNPDAYVFPILTGCKTIIDKENKRNRYKRVSNRMLRKIAEKLGFEVHLCLGLARHSFATRLKLDGTPTPFISDALGHSSMTTTEHYLKSIPDSEFKKMGELLLKF